MKATEATLLQFLNKSPRFVIPIYQRTYSWTEPEGRQLWDDVMRAGANDDVSAHFVGSVVYIEKGLYQVTTQSPLLVIDGQQRLTTVTLLLEVLARHLHDSEPVEGFSAKKIRHYYLLNELEEGDRAFKLILTQTDKDTLISLVQQKDLPAEHSLRLQQNFEFFEGQIARSWARSRRTLQWSEQACHRRRSAESRPGQPSAHLRKHELHWERTQPGRLDSQLHPHGSRASAADRTVRGSLATHGSQLWPGSLWRSLRQFHAPLSDPQDR